MIVKVHLLAFTEGKIRDVDIELEPEHWQTEPVGFALEEVFYWGQNDHQPQDVPSVSMGDVAELWGKKYLCCSVGWKELTPAQFEQYKAMSREDRLLNSEAVMCVVKVQPANILKEF